MAAEGPCDATYDNFMALVGETQAKVSISLVDKYELSTEDNIRFSSYLGSDANEIIIEEIKSDKNPNEIIRGSYHVQLIDSYINNEASLEYEILLINNKYNLRIYNTNWQDHEPTDPNRIGYIVIFMKKIKSFLEQLEGRAETPAFIVNCNAGIGRAGTFSSVYELIENYSNNQKIIDIAEFIVNARKYRSDFVYNSKQYGMIKHLAQSLPQ